MQLAFTGRMRTLLLVAFCYSGILVAQAETASCGGAPSIELLDTLANGGIVFRESQNPSRLDTSYPSTLRRAVDSILERNRHVAIAAVEGACSPPQFTMYCFPGSCNFTIAIDTVLKGGMDKRPFSHSFLFGCGYDNPDSYLQGKRFLLWSDSLPYARPTASGPCYSFPRGFFIENSRIVSPSVAVGQSLPLSALKKYPVGLAARARRPAAPETAPRIPCRVDGRTGFPAATLK